MSQNSRRRFLQSGLAGLAGVGALGRLVAQEPEATNLDEGAVELTDLDLAPRRAEGNWLPPTLALSSYSLWHFDGQPAPMEDVIEEAARLDIGAVDVLHRQLREDDPASLRALRRRALDLGVSMCCLSTHQGFLSPDADSRRRNIEHTIHTLQVAAELGIPLIRVNTGNWGTLSFTELMDAKGHEAPPEGLSVEQGFSWVIDAYAELCERAQELGVRMAMENHWGLARRVEEQLRLVDAVDSPWLVAMMDTGNLLDEDRYEQMEMLAPRAALVQAKTYFGGGIFYDLDIDYERARGILEAAAFSGYLCLEFEGKMEPREGVRRSVAMLRDVVGVRG